MEIEEEEGVAEVVVDCQGKGGEMVVKEVTIKLGL